MNSTRFKGFRTLAINAATLIVAAGALLTGQVDDPETLKVIVGIVAAANIVLRFFTNTKVGPQA